MTVRAIFRRGFVEQYQLALDLLLQHVAHRAAHIGVRSRQRELSSFIVVKCGGRPPLVDVAVCTFCDSVLRGKLAAVRVAMAGLAIRRRPLELYFM